MCVCMYSMYVCTYVCKCTCVDRFDKPLLFLNTWPNCQTSCARYLLQTHAMSYMAEESWWFGDWQSPHTHFLPEGPNRLWGPPSRVAEVKQSEREADITSNSAEIRNEWSYTGTAPHTYIHTWGAQEELEIHGNGSGWLYNSRSTTKTVFLIGCKCNPMWTHRWL